MKISFLIPCYNEEKTIRRCIKSVLEQTRPADEVIVVDDGSTDHSGQIIASFASQPNFKAICLKKNTGNKSRALEVGLKTATGNIVVFTDADSYPRPDYLENIVKHFDNPAVGAVAGKVVSLKNNWLTSVRALEYVIAHDIHKEGQHILGSVLVVPGCAGAFRADVLKKAGFDHDTVTEDLDITLKIHKLKYKIVYEKQAVVYTNDPYDIRSYIKQLRRWNIGLFQALRKHKDIIGKGWIGRLEIPAAIFEGLFFGIFFLVSPILLFFNPYWVLTMFAIDIIILTALAIYGAVRLKRFGLIKAVPAMYFIRVISDIVWLRSLVEVIVLKKHTLVWFRANR